MLQQIMEMIEATTGKVPDIPLTPTYHMFSLQATCSSWKSVGSVKADKASDDDAALARDNQALQAPITDTGIMHD